MFCELVKKTLAQTKLTNKPSEIKENEDEQSEWNQAKNKPFDKRQNEPTVMIWISKNIPTNHQQISKYAAETQNLKNLRITNFFLHKKSKKLLNNKKLYVKFWPINQFHLKLKECAY